MTTNNLANHHLEDQMLLISQYYPGIYTNLVPEQGGEEKPRRRRRKSKAVVEGGGGAEMLRKRKLSEEQVKLLEQSFGDEHKLETERKDRLASELGLDPRQVAVWFQNRRARWKSKRIEEEYSKLKSEHDITLVEKCHLETEVLKLKEQLSDTEKKIQRLVEMLNGSSPCSSFSMDQPSMAPYVEEEFVVEGFENVYYVPDWTDHHLYM